VRSFIHAFCHITVRFSVFDSCASDRSALARDLGSLLCTQVLRTASVADFLQTGNLYDDQFVPHNITLCADPKP
jgi:hypothetical protein